MKWFTGFQWVVTLLLLIVLVAGCVIHSGLQGPAEQAGRDTGQAGYQPGDGSVPLGGDEHPTDAETGKSPVPRAPVSPGAPQAPVSTRPGQPYPVSAVNGSVFTLTSEAGTDGGTVPAEYTCDGAGSTMELSWDNTPEGTKEFAVMMTTLPGDGTTKWSWVMYGIPGNVTGLSKNSTGVGINGVGSHSPRPGYNPPCSQGPGAKVYTITVYALSSAPAIPGDPGQVTGPVLSKAISSLTIRTASINMSYTRP